MALALGSTCINALRNVRTLPRDDVLNADLVGMKHIVVVDVTDFANRVANDLIDGHHRLKRLPGREIRNRDLPAHDHRVTFRESLTSDATRGILFQTHIEN